MTYASWVLEATLGERSWLNPDAASKGGVGILFAHKYARLVTEHRSLYKDRVVWINMEVIKGGSIGFTCV